MSVAMTHRTSVLGRLVADGRGERVLAAVRVPAVWILAASAGLVITAETARDRDDPTAGGALASTSVAVAGLLAMLTAACAAALGRSESLRRHVFHARRILASGVGLLLIAAMHIHALVWRGAFVHVRSELRLGAGDIADAGLLVATMVCLTFAGAALLDACDACHDERDWDSCLTR